MQSDPENIGSTLETQRWQLPPLPAKKKPRPAYRKSDAVRELEALYMAHHRKRYPNMPEAARTGKKYEDRTANGMTKCCIDFIRLMGGQAERINTIGRYQDNSQTFTDVIGRQRSIGTGQWLPTSGQRGSADISATIRGKSVKLEIKAGRDRQSEDQKRYQEAIEKAGGTYLIVRSFEEFKQWYDNIE